MLRAELRSRLGVKLSLLDHAIVAEERLAAEGNFVRLHDHTIVFSADQATKVERLQRDMAANPFSPPNMTDMNALVGEDVVRALIDLRQLVNVNENIAFAFEDYERMVGDIRQHIKAQGEIDAKTLRDMFGTSRKYAIAVLEHLDSLGVTQRVGDVRKPGRNL